MAEHPPLHYQTLGDGNRTVIVLHGLFGLAANLGPVARDLATGFRVVLADLRNHGASFHDPVMDYPAMAGDICALMDAAHIDAAALLGHSMGGKVAMQLALDHPGRVERLIVADIAPVDYAPHHSRILAALSAVDAQPNADRTLTKNLLEAHLAEPQVISFLLMNRRRTESGAWAWRFNLSAILANYEQILRAPKAEGNYAGKVLFIKGENSDYILDEYAEATRRFFPRAQLKSIAGAGHWLHAEQPQAFLRAVRGFLLN